MPFKPQQFKAHDCKGLGYHRLAQPDYLDQQRRRFVRHCKSCEYIYAGEIVFSEKSGKVKVVPIMEREETIGAVSENAE